jgi:histone-lysine N-methyltransferase ASH1L
VVKELSQKRKVPPMPKGWVYVDKGMEKIRIEEARKDKEIAWLQKEGILPATFRSKQPKTRTCSSGGKEKAI